MAVVLGFDLEQRFRKIKDSAISAIKNTFPIEGRKHKLILNNVWVEEGLDAYSSKAQKSIKLKKGTWAEPIYTSLSLIDLETGDEIDKVKKFKLFNLPKETDRFSYIIDGNEYQTINQLRLKSGVYSRIKANNQLESQFNLARGMNFKIILNQETETFYINISTSNIKLLPILLGLGVSKGEITAAWGSSLLDSNLKSCRSIMSTEIIKFHNKLIRKEVTSKEEAIVGVSDYFLTRTQIDPTMTKQNLGTSYKKVEPRLLLDASKKILNIAKGLDKPDDRDSLISKEIHSIEDFVYERFDKNRDAIEKSIKRNIDKRSKIREIISLDTFNNPIKTLFTSTSLATTTEQTNLMDMISNQWKVTIMGEGGITNERQITSSARAVHPSHLGFLDPFQTPESENIGATLQMAMNAAKDGKELKTMVFNLKGRDRNTPIQITPFEFFNNYVAFPDEYILVGGKRKPKDSQITAMYKGEIIEVSPTVIKYVPASDKGLLGHPSNLIPFVNSDNGNRVLMAAKMLGQALALKNREEPLVQTAVNREGFTFHEAVSMGYDTEAYADGEVVEIEEDLIKIRDKKGKVHDHEIYNNFPLNQKTFINEQPIVNVGDKVKEGQRIAETNYTKDGKLALGLNLKAAYLPIKGYSFEDSIVISESASQKLMSEHMYKESVRLDSVTVTNLRKFQAYYPGLINTSMSSKLDVDGVIKKGKKLEKGDIIIAAMQKIDQSAEDNLLARISKSLVKPYKNKSKTWEYTFPAVVTDVVKTNKYIDVYIKSEEPAVIGDKLSGVHGNKGTIGLILPDNEMPQTADMKSIDIALNPHGVITRMNPGQLLEALASKIAEKTGKTYIINNFEDKDYHAKVMADAKRAGVSDTEVLLDPITGKSLGKIMVGNPYILKLNHPTRKKFSARSYGEGYTSELSPGRGGSKGGQSMDPLTINSLLSHGSRAILRETHQIKSEQNDEYWRALQLGQPLPPPKNTFIYDKFIGYLKGTGVDVVKNGNRLQLLPMTSKDIGDISNGEIKSIAIVRGKNLKAEKDGLFGANTGGLQGSSFTHISLHEPIPNPLFENAIKAITGLKAKEYEGLINGNVFIDKAGNVTEDMRTGTTGGQAIEDLLAKVKVDKSIKELETRKKKAKKAELDKINKKLRYLKALKRMGKKPKDYVLDKIPVVPPKFRPIYTLPDGNPVVSDLNYLYKDVKGISDQLKDSVLPEFDKKNLRRDLYKSVKALFGLGKSLTKPDLKGTLLEIRGENPKTGLFQSRLVKRRQDLTGRSVITPGPNLGVDEAGIPEPMAWSIYKPFVVKRLVQNGLTPLEAQQQIVDKTPAAKIALENEMAERYVMLNRAPSLHKFSIMAFKPKLIPGKAIRLPNLVCKGYSSDFNGDSCHEDTLINIISCDSISDKRSEFCCTIGDAFERLVGKSIDEMMSDASGYTAVYEIPSDAIYTRGIVNGQISETPIKQLTVHTSHGPCYKIKTHTGTTGVFSEHHNFSFVGDCIDLLLIKTEDMSPGCLIPKVNLESSWPNIRNYQNTEICDKIITIDEDFAYLLGFWAGDGHVSDRRKSGRGIEIGFTDTENTMLDHVESTLDKVGIRYGKRQSTTIHKKCKTMVYNNNFGEWLIEHCGVGFAGKIVPTLIFNSPYSVRLAYIHGLFEAEGNVSNSGNGKSTMRIEMNNDIFIRQFRILMSTCGIDSYYHETFLADKAHKAWKLTISTGSWDKFTKMPDAPKFNQIQIAAAEYNKAKKIVKEIFDIVPISPDVIKAITKAGNTLNYANRELKKKVQLWRSGTTGRKISFYSHFKNKKGICVKYISRKLAFDVIHTYGILAEKDSIFERWINLVKNTDLMWEQIVSINEVEREAVLFDFSVPEGETFSIDNGLITHNTMSVHIPVTEDGKREAARMLPSNHLINPGSKELMLVPSQEALIGLYLLTKGGKRKNVSLSNIIEVRDAIKKDTISTTDIITVAGIKTTAGRYLFNEILPRPLRDYNKQIDKKALTDILMKVNKKYKVKYNSIVDAISQLGNKHAYHAGFTVTMKDIVPIKADRDRIIKAAIRAIKEYQTKKNPSKVQLENKKIEIFTEATEKIKKVLLDKNKMKDNVLYQMATSGARGNINQVGQIIAAPMLLVDTDGKTISKPITKSYSEGLSTSELWIGSYGARKGAIDKSRETSGPGNLSKMLASTTMNNVISINDCMTRNGITMNIMDKDIFDRFSSENVPGVVEYNGIITPVVVGKAKNKKRHQLKVKSPLKCEAVSGVCSKCSGLDENGQEYEIGTNIGVLASQTISEPAVQLILRAFHTGGAAGAGSKIIGAFDRLEQLLTMPETLPGKATLASIAGQVTKIEKSTVGGSNVYIGNTKHHVRQGFDLRVKKDDQVKAGDALSGGVIKPQELLEHKGMGAVQDYMTKELYNLYEAEGPIRKSVIEQIIRAITSLTKVHSPGSSSYIAGDIAPLRKIENLNKGLDKHDRIIHEPILKGINMLPTAISAHEDADWLGRMGYRYLLKTMSEGATQGWSSDIHGYHPIPGLVYSREFGKSEQGKY